MRVPTGAGTVIRSANAIRYYGTVPEESGRNQPLRVAVQTDDGEIHDAFLKPSGRREVGISGMAFEALAAMVAGDLKLPVCEPFLVEIDAQFIASVKDSAAAAVLAASSKICFASKAAGSQWAPWTAEEQILADRLPMALAITAFDAFAENIDRGPSGKANLFVKGDQFRIFDHELALRVRGLFPAPAPWRAGYLTSLPQPGGHVLARKLKGNKDLQFGPIKEAWGDLSDARMDAYLAALPTEWAEAMPSMQAAVNHLKKVRDNIDACIAELSRALT